MRYILIFMFLPMLCTAQFMQEQQIEIDLSAQADSVDLYAIPAGCAVEYAAIIIDTTVANVNVFTVRLKGSQVPLVTYNFVGETDVIGTLHADRPDEPTGTMSDTAVLYYTTVGGDAATGRVRVYIRYVQLY